MRALEENWFYGWGAYGQKATPEFVDSLIMRYPEMNTKWRSYMLRAVKENTRLCDCYGLVKSYLWWQDDGIKYNREEDRNTLMAVNYAQEKGPLSNMPDLEGVILYMKGHVGVYIGNGMFIEIMGGGIGASLGRVSNGKIIEGSRFTHWFKDRNIMYNNEKELDFIQEISNRGILKNPEYWRNKLPEVLYLNELFENFYNYITENSR